MEADILQDIGRSLPAALWAFTGVLAYCAMLATYVVVFEQRRRKRTKSDEDDWR